MRWKYLIPGFRRAQERDIQEELAALAEMAGHRELGNLTLAAENARAVWGWTWLESLLADVRYAIRTLRRQPSFTAIAVISLALGIGANAAIFSLMDALLWRDLPVRDPERLVTFYQARSYLAYTRFTEHAGNVLESVIGSSGVWPRWVDTGSGPDRGRITFVTGNFFEVLGVGAQMGRTITPDDDRPANASQVAVLSDSYWRRVYRGQPVLGRQIRVDNTPYTIIGVAPREFFGLDVEDDTDFYLPVATIDAVLSSPVSKSPNFLTLAARLRPKISVQRAADALAPLDIQIDIERNGPPANEKDRKRLFESKLKLEPAAKGISYLRDRFSKPLHVVFWMVALGLLLACVNVMSLEFARADERRRELTVRLAIGASRWRIARQLLTESLVVALAGGLLGVSIRRPLAEAVQQIMVVGNMPVSLNLVMHSGVLWFVLGVSFAASLISGVAPAMRATREATLPGLQQGSRTATFGRSGRLAGRAVAAIQMAVSLVLVAGTCLFVFSLHQLRHFDGGLNRDRLLVMDLHPKDAGFQGAPRIALDVRLRERLAAVPGVEIVSYSQNGLYLGRTYSTRFDADGFVNADPRQHVSHYDHVGPGFFTTIGGHILAGRDFNSRDDAGAPRVAIVARELARRVFEDRDPVGRNLYLATGKGTIDTCQVVGVVEDIRRDVRKPEPMFYLSELQTQAEGFGTVFLVRTRLDEASVMPSLRAAVRMEDTALRVEQLVTAWDLFNRTVSTDRLIAALAWGFGVLAIVLAAVGVYGLLSYEVTRRTAEIGIRMAVGAQKGDVVALVMREVALICGSGLAAGSAAALGMSKLVEGLVFQMKAGDPRMEAAAAAILVVVAISAAWIPGRRAARLDPMAALRSE